jgi:hypothetical protein
MREWRFAVTVDDRAIGEHRFSLRPGDGGADLTSEARFLVRILFFEAYRYEHTAREAWRGNCLQSLRANTRTNDERIEVTGGLEGDAFRIATAGSSATLDGCVQTFAYWNPSILQAKRLLNPQTGEYVAVTVTHLGRETLAGRPADRYRLVGGGKTPLRIDLWYTPERDWIGLESRTPEGRLLRYTRK